MRPRKLRPNRAGRSLPGAGPRRNAQTESGVQWYNSVFELIDMRSFSNLWYWVALAVFWSSASHYVLGVPFDMVARARRHGGQPAQDLDDMVRINVNRLLYIGRVAGPWLVGITSFLLTSLALLGFVYRIEFCQAVFMLALPMVLLGFLRVRTAERIAGRDVHGPELWRQLTRHRFWTQALGILSIFLTATWGMYQNMTVGVLGG